MSIGYAPNYGQNPLWPGSYPAPTPIVPTPVKQEITRVHGEEGAKAYPLAPNSSVLLLDETEPVIWLKTTDGASYPTLTPYDVFPRKPKKDLVEEKPLIDPAVIDNILERLSNIERMLAENGKSNASTAKQQYSKQPESSGNNRDKEHDRDVKGFK